MTTSESQRSRYNWRASILRVSVATAIFGVPLLLIVTSAGGGSVDAAPVTEPRREERGFLGQAEPGYVPAETPIRDVLESVYFEYGIDPELVLAGRLLSAPDIESLVDVLDDVDFDGVRPHRRGSGWVMVTAPYEPEKKEPRTAVLRFVERPDGWRLEHLRIR